MRRRRRCDVEARAPPSRRTSGTSRAAPGNDRAHLEDIVVSHHDVARQELVAPDDEHRARQNSELEQELLHAALAGDLDFPSRIAQDDLHGLASVMGSPSNDTRATSKGSSDAWIRKDYS